MSCVGNPFVPVSDDYISRGDGTRFRERVWQGTQSAVQANLATLENGVRGPGDEVFARLGDGPVHQLVWRTTETPFSSQYQVRVTVSPNIVQKSLLEPPVPGRFSGLTMDEIIAVKDALNSIGEDRPSLANPDSQRLFDLIQLGTEFRNVTQQILTKTTVAPAKRPFLYSYVNIDAILSTTSMLIDAGLDASGLQMTLPDLSFPAFDDVRYNLQYGWQKIYPDLSFGSHEAAILTQQYQYGLWHLDIYDYIG